MGFFLSLVPFLFYLDNLYILNFEANESRSAERKEPPETEWLGYTDATYLARYHFWEFNSVHLLEEHVHVFLFPSRRFERTENLINTLDENRPIGFGGSLPQLLRVLCWIIRSFMLSCQFFIFLKRDIYFAMT